MACSTLVGRDPQTLTQEEITALVQVCCAAHDLNTMAKMQDVFEDLKDYFTEGYIPPHATNCIRFLPKNPSGYINCIDNTGLVKQQSTSVNVSDVVKAFEETINVLSPKMQESTDVQSWPGVFPTGINSVSIIVKVGGTDIEILVKGPDPKA